MLAGCLIGLAVLLLYNRLPLVDYRAADQVSLPYMFAVDNEQYLALAQGRFSEVQSPFTKRFLYPWLVRTLAGNGRLPLGTAAMTLNFASWCLLACCLAAALESSGGNPWLAVLFLATPLQQESLLLGYMPDLFVTALTALFFLLLARRREGWAMVVLLLCFLARESTLLICVMCAGFGFLRRDKTMAYGGLAVLAGGVMAGAWFGRLGQPNMHHLPDFGYMVLKVPYNFLHNVFGIMIWSNVHPDFGVPVVRWTLPHFLQFGADTEIGLVFGKRPPTETFLNLFTVFGFAPMLLWRWRGRIGQVRQWPVAVQLAFAYGLVMYPLATGLGAWTGRLIGYAWPLFWLAGPCVFKLPGLKARPADAAFLALCYLLVAWMPELSRFWHGSNNYPPVLLLIPVLYALALRSVARTETLSGQNVAAVYDRR